MRWALWITTTLGIALGVYISSPLIALHGIASAVEAQDAAALSERLEFPALRRSLTKQIVAEYLKLTGKKLPIQAMARTLVVSVADPIVARLMTVRAILDLLGKGELEKRRNSRSIVLPSRRLHSKAFGGSGWNPTIEEARRAVQSAHSLALAGGALELPEDLKERLARELIKLTQDRINSVQ